MKVRKAIIPAAGLGTRMLPATKSLPKEMLPVLLKPALQYIVEEAAEAGIESICIITGRNKSSVEDHFDHSPEVEALLEKKNDPMLEEIKKISDMADIYYIRQKEPNGLGHAVRCAKNFVGSEPFAVLLGDDIVHSPGLPAIGQLMKVQMEKGGSVVGTKWVPWEDISKYGTVEGEEAGERLLKVKRLIEKPRREEAPTNLAILGRYVLENDIFDYIDRVKPGKNGEIQLTDAINDMAQDRPVYALNFLGKRYDTGNKMGYLQTCVEYALRDETIHQEFLEFLKKIIEENQR